MRTASRRRVCELLVACALLLPTAAHSAPATNYDGVWNGELRFGSFVMIPRIRIEATNVQVFSSEDRATFSEVRPGTFRFVQEGTNAIIYSMVADSARPPGEGWVESWVFTTTLRDADTMRVTYSRMVNNNDLPITDDRATFTSVMIGDLRRTPLDHV